MTELSDSTALCNQLNFHESEDDNDNDNVNEIFIGNISQNSTPEDTPMNNSLNIQNDIKDSKRSNDDDVDDDNNVNVEYNDTIDEYIKTTKKKTPQTKTNAISIKKPKASSTSIKKNTSTIKHSSTSVKKNTNSITKTKPKSIKASHSTVTTASRSSNFTKSLPQSKTVFGNNNNNNTSSKKLNVKVKVKATSSTAVKPKTSKNTINSNNTNTNKHKRTKSAVTNVNKEGTITSHSNNTITKKEDILPSNMSLHLPTTEQAQTNVDNDNNNGLTQLIFSKDESNDVSTISAQRVPARKRTRRDSYKHSIMVVQEKLLKKEEEKGESNKISFNDNEHQIRRKRSALGDFKDIDENATKQPPKLRKSSRKFTALRSGSKVVNKQNQNEDINTNDNNNNKINDNTVTYNGNNDNEDDRKGNFEFEHSPIIEEKHDYGSTERKKKHNEMNDKFMKLFNEIKNKIQIEKEKTKQQQLKLKKSSSTPLINTKNKSLIYTTKTNDNITTKRQLLSDLLKQNTRNNNSNTDRNTNNNNEDLKRSAELKTKFKLLKRNDINNNNTNTHNHHNKVNSFTNSALLLQLKHEYNKKYLLNNDVLSLSPETENEKEGEGTYKTFEELKSKALGNGLDLNKLSINKSLGIFEVYNHNDNSNINKKSNKNKSSKVRNVHYKGLSLSQLLLSSFMDENGNCDLNAKVCPPNAMEKSKFNYFVE